MWCGRYVTALDEDGWLIESKVRVRLQDGMLIVSKVSCCSTFSCVALLNSSVALPCVCSRGLSNVSILQDRLAHEGKAQSFSKKKFRADQKS